MITQKSIENKRVVLKENENLIVQDIKNLVSSVNSLETSVSTIESEWTETIVNISPSETTYSDGRPTVASGILAMGTTPIELLSAPGVGNYYDIDSMTLEYTHVTTDYSNTSGKIGVYGSSQIYGYVYAGLMSTSGDTVSFIKSTETDVDTSVVVNGYEAISSNSPIIIQADANPTLGDGTLRVIIKYKVRTFGA